VNVKSLQGKILKDVMSRFIKTNDCMLISSVIYAGERWDVVIRANQAVGSYWIKFRGLMDCDDRFTSAFQVAVLNYDPVPQGAMPQHIIRNWHEATAFPGIVIIMNDKLR